MGVPSWFQGPFFRGTTRLYPFFFCKGMPEAEAGGWLTFFLPLSGASLCGSEEAWWRFFIAKRNWWQRVQAHARPLLFCGDRRMTRVWSNSVTTLRDWRRSHRHFVHALCLTLWTALVLVC